MKTFSAELIEQLDAGTAIIKVLAELRFSQEEPFYRYTDADINIAVGGKIFLANGMTVTKYEENGPLTAAQLEIAMPGEVFKNLLMSGEYRGSIGIYYWAALYTWGGLIDYGEFFRGMFDDFSPLKEPIPMSFTSEMIEWMEKHMIGAMPTCNLPFKGTRCGYSGINSYCDHTYALCTIYENTDNFRGSRWLPVVSEQELAWGRTD